MGNELTNKEVRDLQLELIKYFDEICTKNNLRYYLAGGTLIGAVRHKGFIPWDDDIDISMPRVDYNKLIEIMENNPGEHQKLLHFAKDEYYYLHGRIVDTRTTAIDFKADETAKDMGVFIDIFPLDGAPDTKFMALVYELKVKWYYNIEKAYKYKKVKNIKNPIKKIIVGLGYWYYTHVSSYEKLCYKLNKQVTKYDFDKKNNFCSYAGVYRLKEVVPKSKLGEIIRLDFEDMKLCVMKEYDAYLRHYYGDYMQLPPKEKQVAHHEFEYRWR